MTARVYLISSVMSLLSVCAGLIGCSASNEGADAGALVSPSCEAIMAPCHVASPNAGPAAQCHAVAHADVERDCSAMQLQCVSACEAALSETVLDAAGGAGGESGAGGADSADS